MQAQINAKVTALYSNPQALKVFTDGLSDEQKRLAGGHYRTLRALRVKAGSQASPMTSRTLKQLE